MIEFVVYQYLLDKIGLPVYFTRPNNPEDEYLLVEKTSGYVSDFIHTDTFAIRSKSTSLAKAAQLSERVIDAMLNIDDLPNISAVSLNTETNFTNTILKEYRYQALFQITYMED